MHIPKHLCDVTHEVEKATEEKKTKLDGLKCSPGSDIESQNLLNNVCPGHGQSRHIVLTYSFRPFLCFTTNQFAHNFKFFD